MLTDEAVADIMYAVATGMIDQAKSTVETSSDLDDDARATLLQSLAGHHDASRLAGSFGDALRALGAPRDLVNECYRVSFYAGDQWRSQTRDPLFAYFTSHRSGRPLDKWPHYFPIYDHHLGSFRDSPVRVLEIGVYRGGGLELLRDYLGDRAVIIGIDIDEDSARAAGDGFVVEVGDQEDQDFLARVVDQHGPFDVVIDDGGHTMRQQITSVEVLFPLLTNGGVYIVEDCHTSYWPEYADPGDRGRTFIGWVKDRIDDLNAYHFSRQKDLPAPWATSLRGLHIYDSVVVLDKALRSAPFSELSGTNDYIFRGRRAEASNAALIAERDAARNETARTYAEHQAATARWEAEVARVESVALSSQATTDEMRGSTSWRMTEPLRRLGSLFRR